MGIEINSTWFIDDVEGFESGNYRVLTLLHRISSLIIFKIPNGDKINRPTLISIDQFNSAVRDKRIKSIALDLSSHLLTNDENISEGHKKVRDNRYLKIKNLIEDDRFLFDLATSKNIKSVTVQANKVKTDNKSIYRLLNLYWKNGQTINGLLPAYNRCGAKGKIRTNVKKSLGTQLPSRTGSFEKAPSYIVREDDLIAFKKI